ncbi:MAG: hypothetical protein HOK52_00915 [Candidatus Marinimicrobia bacterium]|jgi:pyruvate dehydrogenase E1 component beta subunit|nr:hypothetical protein [Candidatus Neomarinimicrobiota bacterium]
MEQATVAETIRELTRKHLEEDNGLLLGQTISAVGWVNGTVPNCKGIVELPMTDVAGAGIAVGSAMVGRRPIFVLRFQDFIMLNGSPIFNYAAKVKELHGQSAPIFVRVVGSEGLGVVHSGVMHSLPMHYPGMRVWAPMTPWEYKKCWDDFMDHDDPMYVSEHKESFQNREELPDIIRKKAKITIYAIGATRFSTIEAIRKLEKEGVFCNLIHIYQLKPMIIGERETLPLTATKKGLVIDAGFEICGAARDLAYCLTDNTGIPVKAFGLKDCSKVLCEPNRNPFPNKEMIMKKIKEVIAN